MKKIRAAAGILCFLLLLSFTAASCASNDGSDSEVTKASGETTASTASETTGRADVSANLPEMNYEGANFTILTTSGMEYEIWADELNGEVTNDAVYRRNSNVMGQFNINLLYDTKVNTDLVLRAFRSSIIAGDQAYQLLANYAYTSYIAISNGLCANWTELEYVDLDQPWWNKLSNDEATINGKLFAAVSDFSVSAMLYTYSMFVNIDLAQNWNINISDIYQTVHDGGWTIDKLMSLTKDIYSDADGDGARGKDDVYGYSGYHDESADMFQISFDNPITKKDSDGMPYSALMTEKLVSALEKVITLTYDQVGSFKWTEWGGEATLFNNQTVVIVPSYFKQAFDKFRYMDNDYAMIPYPKWNDAQSDYYTGAMDEYSVLMIPYNSNDTEMAGIIAEALAVESYRLVTPAYYDIALKGKYAVDEETAEMIDIIMDGRRFDLAFMFGTSDQLKWLPYIFRKQVEAKNTDIASAYAAISDTVEEGYKTIASYYQ